MDKVKSDTSLSKELNSATRITH